MPRFHYSRLFREAEARYDPAVLAELAERMRPPPGRERTERTPVSGYVYFGQFIDHDLTRDDTKLSDLESGTFDPEGTPNHRTPLLDLDSLYGAGPTADGNPELYDLEHFRPENARFKIGATDAGGTSVSSTPDDLPRRDDHTAVLVDDRNDENPILSQLHVLFLKFHNRICELLEATPPQIDSAGGTNIFEQARRLVTWHYQWFVRNDFLPEIVLQSVLTDIQRNGPKLFSVRRGDPIALPIEFTMAAYRFGHSMVQDSYTLNNVTGARSLSDLFNLTRTVTGGRKPLPSDAVIDWARFLGVYNDGMTEFAETLDTIIANGLFHLPPDVVALFISDSSPTVLALPLRTLRRGSAVRLPSGQAACREASSLGVTISFIPFTGEEEAFLREHGLFERTPLWYYILHEAAVEGDGRRLGSLGGRIVAEVLLGALEADSNSFIYSNWRPPTPTIAYGPTSIPQPINSLRQLFFFATDKKIGDFDVRYVRESIAKAIWAEGAKA